MRTFAIVALLVFFAAAPAGAAPKAVSGQLIVGFEKKVSSDRQRAVLKQLGAKIHKRLARIRAAAVRPRSGLALSVLRKRLEKHPDVDYVERDYILQRSLAPNDPMLARAVRAGRAGAGIVQAQTAWNKRTNCSKVAVLDTGTQYTHPDLKDNVWHNKHEVDDNGKDDDKNGYVDDYYGLNAIAGKGNAEDKDGHGTHVSGIIAAHGNNALGVSGLCWDGTVMPVKFMNSQGQGSTSDADRGHRLRRSSRAPRSSTTRGAGARSRIRSRTRSSTPRTRACCSSSRPATTAQDIDKDPFYPADYTNGNILCVAAITADDSLAELLRLRFKNVDLGAPGNNIVSTYPTSTYKVLSGTSMATPFVTAAAAMLRSAERRPHLQQAEVADQGPRHAEPGARGKDRHRRAARRRRGPGGQRDEGPGLSGGRFRVGRPGGLVIGDRCVARIRAQLVTGADRPHPGLRRRRADQRGQLGAHRRGR